MITTTHSSVLPSLRQATAALHEKLDGSLPLASAHPSIEDYYQHLQAFKHWLTELGNVFTGSHLPLEELLAINAMSLQLLESDLQAQQEPMLTDGFANRHSIPLSTAFGLGVEYAVKGSALGTAMLYSKVAQRFPSAPMAFMQDAMLHGKDRWKIFLAKLESHAWTEADIASAQEGSIWAFQRFIQLHEMQT